MNIVSDIIQLQSTTAMSTASMVCASAISASFAISFVACRYLDSAARQPEIAGQLFIRTMALCGMIDVVPILGILIGFIYTFGSPLTQTVVSLLPQLV